MPSQDQDLVPDSRIEQTNGSIFARRRDAGAIGAERDVDNGTGMPGEPPEALTALHLPNSATPLWVAVAIRAPVGSNASAPAPQG